MIQTGALRVIVVRHLDDSTLPARVSGTGIAIIRLGAPALMTPPDPTEDLVQVVERASLGDKQAVSHLMPLVYDELRRLARGYVNRERAQTLQPTALVHEAYLRLLKDKKKDWRTRTHFVAIAALSMRQILIERARARVAEKRGGERVRVTLDEGLIVADSTTVDLLVVDAALTRLAEIDPRQARLVELRFFGGLTLEELAEALRVSVATVKRDWAMAKAWLQREMSRGES